MSVRGASCRWGRFGGDGGGSAQSAGMWLAELRQRHIGQVQFDRIAVAEEEHANAVLGRAEAGRDLRGRDHAADVARVGSVVLTRPPTRGAALAARPPDRRSAGWLPRPRRGVDPGDDLGPDHADPGVGPLMAVGGSELGDVLRADDDGDALRAAEIEERREVPERRQLRELVEQSPDAPRPALVELGLPTAEASSASRPPIQMRDSSG